MADQEGNAPTDQVQEEKTEETVQQEVPTGDAVKTEEPVAEQTEPVTQTATEVPQQEEKKEEPTEQKQEEQSQEETGKQEEQTEEKKEEPAVGQTEEKTEDEGQKQENEKVEEQTEAKTEGQTEEKVEEKTEEKVEEQTEAKPDAPEKDKTKESTDIPAPPGTPQHTQQSMGTETEPTKDDHEVDPHATSPRTNLEATATVKIVLMPSGQVVTLACTLGQSLRELKDHFASELKMQFNMIYLMFDGKQANDSLTLADLGVGPNGTIQLELQSTDPVNTPIKTYRPKQEYHMPDVITVRIQGSEDGEGARDVVVEIERATRKKPFIGGYRHKTSGIEFHHASAQTMKKQPPPSTVPKYCRDTQTVEQKHIVQQTTNDMSTQMSKIGVFVSNVPDKLLTPGSYTTADDHHNMILQKIILIQKYYRRWLAKRYVTKLKDDKKDREEFEKQEEIRKKKEKEDRIRKEFERRMNPKSKEDFDLLYHALEKWRVEEMERINQTADGAERKAALCMLLDQETQLISAIGRHKIEADTENKDKRIQQFLSKAAAPKKWKGFDGKSTEMDTPYTIRAKELQDIYNSINMKYLTQDERLDVLLTLKHTVKEHDCKLTQEIIELIDREADLLMRGVRENNLDGLRKRISTLFLQYIKTPTFNPEAAKLLKVPQDPSVLRKNIYFCPSCNQYLPSTDFALSSNSRTVGKCRRCTKIDNDARTRQDFSTFQHMLKSLRKSEEGFKDGSKIAFLLQEQDLRYLVEKIWSGQSILSAWEDLYDLTFVRWDKHQEWSPWNCILLTKDEAASHVKLVDLEEGYGQVFMQKVKQKHTLARNYFSRLPGMAEHVREKANEKSMISGPSVAGQPVPVQSRA
ncbi:IQ motif and ubiquitin-like domain-containing protein isoform X3 [Mytilus galloprovincialis]|uniref:IQ motif and ubiquitin-like domain-containing protein isoform X3 n=1 Tax=Mytilus galloprovincialis TaxID=29158 RepID=UPI003F7C15E6